MSAPRAALLLAVLLALPGGRPAAETVDPADAWLRVELEDLPEAPYEQEMVLLTIRGFYRVSIARHFLEQPLSEGFGWMQLGRDHWSDATVDGRQGRGFERVVAIFPQQAGPVEIGAFVHRMTLLARDGSRFEHRIETAPVSLAVRPKPAGEDWWLPARAITVTDSWDQPPDRLAPGQTATRRVTLEAAGVGPEVLPPAPEMRAPGVIVFVDPEERSTELTPEGPISRVTWRWTLRPASDTAATLQAVTIPWFDTVGREAREIVLAPQRIALAGAAEVADDGGETSLRDSLAARALPIGLAAGFLTGLLLLVPGLRPRSREEIARRLRRLLPDPDVAALRRAVRRGDTAAARRAAHRLLERRPDGASQAIIGPLDRSLFGPDGSGQPVNLRGFARSVLAAWRRSYGAGPDATGSSSTS